MGEETLGDMAEEQAQETAPEPQEATLEAEGTQDTPEPEEAAEDATEAPEEKPKKIGGVQKRINQLTRQAYEREERIRQLEQKLETTEKEKPVEKAPDPNKYDDHDQYLEDKIKFEAKRQAEQIVKDRERQAIERNMEAQAQTVRQQWDAAENSARERYEDYDEVATYLTNQLGSSRNGKDIAKILVEAGDADVAYYLGTHPDEAEKFANLSTPVAVGQTIGYIKAKIGTEKKPPVKRQTPMKPVKSSRSVASNAPSEKDSPEEWARKRNLAMLKRRGAKI